ncbi:MULTISPECIES: hypothetical protein [Agrobacterium]|uniref:hypothetical protein n=1 Tax=Agrobacterium TaxID=357 RepID=UPI0009BC15AD|nr:MULTISPECIES: hypothetical protein [Agrobacterium]QCL77452.1 hypothetical protein CFBP5499_28790 [Agrobacterium tumefaciens]CUX72304.1 conserved hypothetical protein [Agrobacterium sp. NCPPB 925]
MTDKYVIQADNAKADEGAGKLMGYAMLLIGALWAISYAYEVVLGWYTATAAWLTQTADYIASFWPF